MLARTRTAKRRRRILDRAGAASAATPAELPLRRKVVHTICGAANPTCVCAKALDKPACQRIEDAADVIVAMIKADTVNPT